MEMTAKAALNTASRNSSGRSRSRKNALSAIECAILSLLAATLLVCALASGFKAPMQGSTERVRVERGDTLWAIAGKHAVDGLSTEQTADLIARLNHLDRHDLVVGTEIEVPRHPESERTDVASR
jgi:nucleoid-associated protein YgaU